MTTETRTAVADLYRVPDGQKAELVDGEVQLMSPTGRMPIQAAKRIVIALEEYSRHTRLGEAVADNAGFVVNLPHRQSFSPDAEFYTGGGASTSMDFFEGAPVFAVEVRSKNDYGATAERAIALKRPDYVAAGTRVVWDVDLLSPDVVRVYRADTPQQPTIYRRGERAEAEPAGPDWSMPVDDLFPPDWLT